MIPSMVRNQIEASLAAQSGRKAFAAQMTSIADEQGIVLFPEDVDGLVILAERYIRATLRLLENCEVAARQARIEAMLDPLISAACGFYLRPPEFSPDQGGLLGMVSDSYLGRSLFAIASNRMQTVRGFPLLASEPHDEEPVIRTIIGPDLANRLYDFAEHTHDSPQIRFYTNSAYLLQNPLRASAKVNDWGGSWRDDAIRFAKSVGLSLDGGAAAPHPDDDRRAATGF